MFDNFKTYNYSKSLVSPEGHSRNFGASLTGNVLNGLECVVGTGLQVVLKPGNAVLPFGSGGNASVYLTSLTADFTMTAATADASNPRIDAVVLYTDTSVTLPAGTPTSANLDGLGVTKAKIVTGTPNASPTAPNTAAIQSSIGSTSYPYTVLATVRVNAGASSLSQSNLTDSRVFAAPRNQAALGRVSFVESGGVGSFTPATLNGAITAGTAWISVGGVMVRQDFSSATFTQTASRDRYYYVTLGNSTLQQTEVTNGASQPTLPANSTWVAKFISGASAITSVTDLRSTIALPGQSVKAATLDFANLGVASPDTNGAWQIWTPTLGASGSMTFTSTTVQEAKYTKVGKIVFFAIEVTGTLGGTTSSAITFTLPVTAKTALTAFGFAGGRFIDGSSVSAQAMIISTTQAQARRYDSGNISLGSSRGISLHGFYEAA